MTPQDGALDTVLPCGRASCEKASARPVRSFALHWARRGNTPGLRSGCASHHTAFAATGFTRRTIAGLRRGDDQRLGASAGVGGLCRPAVRRRLSRRPPPAVSDATAAAAAGVQPGAGGVLLVVDVLRRGRQRDHLGLELLRHLPRADPAVRAGAAPDRAHDPHRQGPEHHLDRRLHRLAVRQVAAARRGSGPDCADCRHPLRGTAVQGGCDEHPGAVRRVGRRSFAVDPRRHRLLGCGDAGAVFHPVRDTTDRCNRTPSRHDAGGCPGVDGEADCLRRRRHLRGMAAVPSARVDDDAGGSVAH